MKKRLQLLAAAAALAAISLHAEPPANTVVVAPAGAHAAIDTAAAQRAIAVFSKGTAAEKDALVASIIKTPGEMPPPVFMHVATRLFEKGDKAGAYRWFCFGLLRAQYDAMRCADATARQGVSIMTSNVEPELKRFPGTLTPEQVDAFAQSVLALDEATPYAYDHRWINLHGMGAFLNNDGKKPHSVPEAEWPALRKEARDGLPAGIQQFASMLRERQKAEQAQPAAPQPPPAPAAISYEPSAELLKQLPAADAGFTWLVYQNCALLRPDGWNLRTRAAEPQKSRLGSFAMSPEVFSETKYYDHGMSVQIMPNAKASLGDVPSKGVMAFVAPKAEKLGKKNLLVYQNKPTSTGASVVFRYIDAPPNLTPLVIHRYYVADDAKDTVYIFTYEAPQESWEQNWEKYGTPIFKRLLILSGTP